ncbi:hypothetical protein B0T26DRAFT_670786 [Lasiosphaeria miniovina]|uniref:Integral membrane protein n=1 Tax=Lasiosphaeria miniovina TaxID=1954250 RepID=A0AA40EC32_9PEZI|nr:uncharacterized protein B0T26DRAFT_670786 [Lasiosphaeria miniovina]KAK0734495.1 hypothetical protein B0T26DRAFT_670786 [Lasiosphaeria miniovina]
MAMRGCGKLYDANGKCVPPAAGVPQNAPGVYSSCFCADSILAPFKTGSTGVCDPTICTAGSDLASIQGWFTNFCGINGNQVAKTTSSSSSSTSTPGTGSAGVTNANSGGGGGTWLSNHYQWVIFLVVIIVAIVGIWVGACMWRRRYLRKRDRQYALGANLAHATESGRVVPNASNGESIHVPAAGMFDPAPIASAGIYGEKSPKKQKKKWVVKERT